MERIKNISLNTVKNGFPLRNNISFGSVECAQNLTKDSFELSNNTPKDSVTNSSLLKKDFEAEFLAFDLLQFSKTGLPLKYSRKEFIENLEKITNDLLDEEKTKLLRQFNLEISSKDINGIATIPDEEPHTKEGKLIKKEIEKYYFKNEYLIKNKKQKELFESLNEFLPEFNMIIGKKQGGLHIHTLDIHTLLLIQNAIKNPLYKELNQNDKKVLMLSALMHDFGKRGAEITPGHAYISEFEARKILDKNNTDFEMKNRILNQVRNHHWFSDYNQKATNEKNVVDIFKTSQDLKIAKILAKGDLENINGSFHLDVIKEGYCVTQEEFEEEFKKKTGKIQI